MWTEAIITGIVAWVFCRILIEPGMIFGGWWQILNRLPEWLSKPLGACEYCFGGQLALWYFIFSFDYSIVHHIQFISVTLITVNLINLINDRIKTD